MTRHGSRQATPFGRNLKAARKARELTQRQVGDVLGVDPITVSRWERGTHHPEHKHVLALGDVLGVDIAALYAEAGEAAA